MQLEITPWTDAGSFWTIALAIVFALGAVPLVVRFGSMNLMQRDEQGKRHWIDMMALVPIAFSGLVLGYFAGGLVDNRIQISENQGTPYPSEQYQAYAEEANELYNISEEQAIFYDYRCFPPMGCFIPEKSDNQRNLEKELQNRGEYIPLGESYRETGNGVERDRLLMRVDENDRLDAFREVAPETFEKLVPADGVSR